MTTSQALSALRRGALPALVASALTLAAALFVLGSQAPRYTARVGLVAVPAAQTDASAPSFGEVVALVLPALPELVASPTVQQEVERRVAAAGAADAQTTVELVPSSAVARISVTASSERAANDVLTVLVERVEGSDLLAPSGRFTTIGDTRGSAVRVQPDRLLTLGLALVAAAVVGLIAVAAVQVLRPRLLSVGDVERTISRTLGGPVPVLATTARLDAGAVLGPQLRLGQQEPDHLLVVPAGRRATAVPVQPLGLPVTVQDAEHPSPAAVRAGSLSTVTVVLRQSSPAELERALLQAAASGAPLAAVVVASNVRRVRPGPSRTPDEVRGEVQTVRRT